jgi:hypothetical protein
MRQRAGYIVQADTDHARRGSSMKVKVILISSYSYEEIESEIQEWLDNNKDVNIEHVAGVGDHLVIFYHD